MRTGDTAVTSGTYQNTCCGTHLFLADGQKLPVCACCYHSCTWAVVRWEEGTMASAHLA